MQIAFFIYSLGGGGAERVTTHMAEYWSRKDHKVTIFTMASTESNRYQLPNSVALVALEIDGKSRGPLTAAWSNIHRISVLRKELRKHNPDIIISMMSPANIMTGIACIGLRTKCIGSERSYPGYDHSGRLWDVLRRFTYRLIDTVITQTDAGKYWIQKHTNAHRVVAIPNPIVLPLPANDPVVTPPSKTNRKYVIGTGRLIDLKQFHHLIKAFANISGDIENWDLTIVGEGENMTELKNLASQLGVRDRVIMPGRVGNIADWYLAADIFVMTSETEGFPNALIEAMAHGVAAISYDCLTGPSEIIESGLNGVLVKTNDQADLEIQIRYLIENSQKRKNLAMEGKKITTTLDMNSIMTRWDKEITNVLTRAN